jgi:hypothetical protein
MGLPTSITIEEMIVEQRAERREKGKGNRELRSYKQRAESVRWGTGEVLMGFTYTGRWDRKVRERE